MQEHMKLAINQVKKKRVLFQLDNFPSSHLGLQKVDLQWQTEATVLPKMMDMYVYYLQCKGIYKSQQQDMDRRARLESKNVNEHTNCKITFSVQVEF